MLSSLKNILKWGSISFSKRCANRTWGHLAASVARGWVVWPAYHSNNILPISCQKVKNPEIAALMSVGGVGAE